MYDLHTEHFNDVISDVSDTNWEMHKKANFTWRDVKCKNRNVEVVVQANASKTLCDSLPLSKDEKKS